MDNVFQKCGQMGCWSPNPLVLLGLRKKGHLAFNQVVRGLSHHRTTTYY